ncbi:MAG: HEAT repeat domain-containing protein [Pirellulales bacterium]
MTFFLLEQAILKNDRASVIQVFSGWNEDDIREAKVEFESFCRALGTYQSIPIEENELTWAEREKREQICDSCGVDNLVAARAQLNSVVELAYVGFCDKGYLPIDLIDYPHRAREFAQLWIDRKPIWFNEWYRQLTSNIAWGLDPVMWVCFFRAEMVPAPEEGSVVLERLVERFPKAYDTCPEESQWTLRRLPGLRNSVYRVYEIGPWLAGDWAPAVDWLSRNGLVDRPVALAGALQVLKKTKKAADRRSLVRFIRAIDATGKELADKQEALIELLSDKLLDIAGNAAIELSKIASGKLLSDDKVLEHIHRVFQQKTKLYAKKALEIIASLADSPDSAPKAMVAAIAALDHADKTIQKEAMQLLKRYLKSAHGDALELLAKSKDRLATHLGPAVLELLNLSGIASDVAHDVDLPTPIANTATPKEYATILKALKSGGSNREQILRDAYDAGKLHDPRFLDAILDAIDERNQSVADFVADEVLPSFGPKIFPQLKDKFDFKGKLAHARRLRLMYRLDPVSARPFVELGLKKGSEPVKVVAIACLEDRDADWEILSQSVGSSNKETRRAAFHSLSRIGNDRAVSYLLGVLDSEDAPILVDFLVRFTNPTLAGHARLLVQQKLKELIGADHQQLTYGHPRLIAQIRIAASIPHRDTTELLVECLRTAQTMIELSRWAYDIEATALELLMEGDDESFKSLLDARQEIPVTTLDDIFLTARKRMTKEDVFEIFSPYILESRAHGRTREYYAYEKIEKAIVGTFDELSIVDSARALRNKDLDPRWLDVAIREDLKTVVLSVVIPGHRGAWEYLLDHIDDVKADNPIVFSGNTLSRLGLILFEHPDAEELCLAAVQGILTEDNSFFRSAFHITSLLSPKTIPELEAMKDHPECTEGNRELLSNAIEQIRKNHRDAKSGR